MTDVRLGIVGMGPRGEATIENLKNVEGCKVVALCEKIGPLLEKGLQKAGDPDVKGYLDFAEMIKEVEAVAVVVEPEHNANLICEALYAGKHVICEVPLALTMEGCWNIVLAVETTGLKFAMAEQMRYEPRVEAWKKLVDGGALGKILFAEGEYIHGMTDHRYWLDAETGMQLTWEEARTKPNAKKSRFWTLTHPIYYLPHELSPLLKVLDDRVTKVSCMGTRKQGYYREELPISDFEVAIMHTAKDTVMRMAVSFNVRTFDRHWQHVLGTEGELETARSPTDKAKVWLADYYMPGPADVEWGFTSHQPAAPGAKGTTHDELDYSAQCSWAG